MSRPATFRCEEKLYCNIIYIYIFLPIRDSVSVQVAVNFINRYRPFILYSQQHGCWVPGNAKSKRISHVIDLVLSVFHVETRLNCVCSNHKSKRIVTHRFQFEFIRISKSWLDQTKVNCIFDTSAKKLFAFCITIVCLRSVYVIEKYVAFISNRALLSRWLQNTSMHV